MMVTLLALMAAMLWQPSASDDDAATDDDIDDDEEQEYEPPDRDQWDRTQAALKKANAEAKKYRLRARDLLKRTQSGDDDDKVRDERIRADADEAAEKKWKLRVAQEAARAALLAAGLNGDAKKLARLVDPAALDFDDDGDVTGGLDDWVDEMKEDYPDLFTDPNRKRVGARSVDGSDRPVRSGQRKLTSAERIAQQTLRRTPR